MSSKLIRKSLELVCGQTQTAKTQKSPKTIESDFPRGVQGLGKINKTRKYRNRKLKKVKQEKGKNLKDKNEDFTKDNLEYLSNTSWKLDRNIYETVINQCQGKKADLPKKSEVSLDQESDHD